MSRAFTFCAAKESPLLGVQGLLRRDDMIVPMEP